MKENPMREIRLEKVTLNMGAGESGPKLEKCKSMMENISGKKVVITKAHKRTPFGVGKLKPIGVKSTLRGPEAKELLKKLLHALDNRISPRMFDRQGNFSFGIHEYINIPGVRYDPDVGILGLDVCVTLTRPGYRIKEKRIRPKKIGNKHRIKPEEAMEFARKELGVNVTEEKD
jgi:large subunit ribosomal protein L5